MHLKGPGLCLNILMLTINLTVKSTRTDQQDHTRYAAADLAQAACLRLFLKKAQPGCSRKLLPEKLLPGAASTAVQKCFACVQLDHTLYIAADMGSLHADIWKQSAAWML